jgi:hypothetical protein
MARGTAVKAGHYPGARTRGPRCRAGTAAPSAPSGHYPGAWTRGPRGSRRRGNSAGSPGARPAPPGTGHRPSPSAAFTRPRAPSFSQRRRRAMSAWAPAWAASANPVEAGASQGDLPCPWGEAQQLLPAGACCFLPVLAVGRRICPNFIASQFTRISDRHPVLRFRRTRHPLISGQSARSSARHRGHGKKAPRASKETGRPSRPSWPGQTAASLSPEGLETRSPVAMGASWPPGGVPSGRPAAGVMPGISRVPGCRRARWGFATGASRGGAG